MQSDGSGIRNQIRICDVSASVQKRQTAIRGLPDANPGFHEHYRGRGSYLYPYADRCRQYGGTGIGHGVNVRRAVSGRSNDRRDDRRNKRIGDGARLGIARDERDASRGAAVSGITLRIRCVRIFHNRIPSSAQNEWRSRGRGTDIRTAQNVGTGLVDVKDKIRRYRGTSGTVDNGLDDVERRLRWKRYANGPLDGIIVERDGPVSRENPSFDVRGSYERGASQSEDIPLENGIRAECGGTSHIPEYVAGLGAVGQQDDARTGRNERGRGFEYENGIGVSERVERDGTGNTERSGSGVIYPGIPRRSPEFRGDRGSNDLGSQTVNG